MHYAADICLQGMVINNLKINLFPVPSNFPPLTAPQLGGCA
jgi:hypothetical protein